MKWLELSIRTTPEYVEPLSALFRHSLPSQIVTGSVWKSTSAVNHSGEPIPT